MKHRNFLFFLSLIILSLCVFSSIQAQVKSTTIDVAGSPSNPLNMAPGDYGNTYGSVPRIVLFANADKTLSVCWTDENSVHVSEFDSKLELQSEVKISDEFNLFGGFTKDDDGNYFILFAKVNTDGDFSSNVKLLKYNNSGRKLGSFDLPTDNDNGFDVMTPLHSGTSRLAYGNGKIAVHMGKKQHKNKRDGLNHQCGIFFMVDANTMTLEKQGQKTNIASHSFDQRVLFDGTNFINLDLADNYPRGILISKSNNGSKIIFTYKTNHPNEPSPYYKGLDAGKWSNDNRTYTELGGIASSDKGYIVTGSSEKSFDNATAKKILNEPRNLFMLLVAPDFEKQKGEMYNGAYPRNMVGKDVVISKGEDSEVIQFYDFGGTANFQKRCGIVWLTNFTSVNENACQPKLAKINDNKFVALYEKWSERTYISTQYIVFDAQGKILKSTTDLGQIRLNRGDDVTVINNKVVWVTGNSIQKQLILNSLEIE